MVRIRLRRVGLKKQPSYRIVVADKERSRDGKVIETIGFYNPRTRPDTINVKEDRALYWLSVGAQPSDPVQVLFKKTGTFDRLARLRAGEALEALAAEGEAHYASLPPVSPKTRFDAPVKAAGKSEAAE